MSNTLMIGLGIVAVGTLAGLVGTLTDTANKSGLKVFLALLVLGAGIAGAYTEIQREASVTSEKKRSEEALRMANESRQMAEEGLLNHRLASEQAEKEKGDLSAKISRRTSIAQSFAGELFVLLAKVDEIEQAAVKARKKQVAELAGLARLEISKMLLKDAKDKQWLAESQSAKFEKMIKKETPFSTKELNILLDALNQELR